MAKDVQIGRVSVKVMPDLDGFAQKVRTELEKIEKRLPELEVDLAVGNEAGFIREVRRTVKAAERAAGEINIPVDVDNQKSLRRALAQIDRELEKLDEIDLPVGLNKADLRAARELLEESLKFEIDVDKSSMKSLERAIGKIDDELARRREVTVQVGMDDESLRKARDDMQREFDRQKQIELDVELDARRAARSAQRKILRDLESVLDEVKFHPSFKFDEDAKRKLRRELQSTLYDLADLDAKLEVELDPMKRARLLSQIDEVTHKLKDLGEQARSATDLDKDGKMRRNLQRIGKGAKYAGAQIANMAKAISGADFVHSFLKPLREMAKNIATTAVPTFGALVLAMNGLAGAVLAGGANLAVLAQDLARIGPAALALPGIFAGMAIGVGASVAVFKDFNEVLPDVGKRFSELQDKMSARFWDKAAEPIEKMIDTLFPAFEAGILKVTDALADFYGSMADALGKRLGGDVLTIMFDRLAESIEITAGYADSFATIIQVLGLVGSKYLPELARWFGDISHKFASWLTESYNSGQIFDWIDRAVDNLKALGRALKAGLGILDNFADAAREAGSSTIQELAGGLERLEQITGSPGFQDGLVTVFRASHEMMGEIARISGPAVKKMFENLAKSADELFPSIGRSIGYLVDTIASAFNSPEFQDGFATFVAGIEKGLETLSGASGDIGATLGAVKQVMGAIAYGAGPLLAEVFETLAMIVEPLADTLSGIFLFGMQSLTSTIQMLQPYIPPIVDAFNNLLLALQPLAESILPIFQALWVKIAEHLPGIIESFAGLLGALQGLIDLISPVLIPVLEFLWETILTSIEGLIRGFEDFIEGFTKVIDGIIDLVKNVFAGDWEAAWESIKQILDGVLQAIWGAIQVWWNGSILAFLRGGLVRLITSWKGGWQTVWSTAKKWWNDITSGIRRWADDLWASFKRMGTNLNTTTLNTWTRVSSHVATGKSKVVGFFKGLVDDAIAKFNNLRNQIVLKVSNAMRDMKNKVRSGIEDVRKFFADMPRKITGAVGNLGGLLWGAGKSVVQGFLDGINSLIGEVQSRFNWLTNMIPTWKGPYKRDKALLTDAGQVIMQSLIDGFESRFGDVRKSLTTLTDEIGGMEVDGPTVRGASLAAAARARATGALDAAGSINERTLNYYAAEGSSISSEEDLFEALDRERSWDF